jgi:sRNA-binding carbon storage regulator CsrA
MLMLTRRKGESVDLIDSASEEVLATVTVDAFLPNGVIRLGFNARGDIRIVRDNAIRRHGNGASEEESEVNGNR